MTAMLLSRRGKSRAVSMLILVAMLAMVHLTAKSAKDLVFVPTARATDSSAVTLLARGGHREGEKEHSHGHNAVDVDSHMVGGGVTRLMNAAHEGDFEKAIALIKSGADINAKDDYGWTALRYAVRNGHYDTAFTLIHNSADLNLASNTGRTPLMSAAGNNKERLVELLVASGADLMVKDDKGKTAYDLAMRGGPTGNEIIRELVAGGQTPGVTK